MAIPANYVSERFYNLPIDEFMENVDAALDRGFTLALDGDFTEPYFGNGVAVFPVEGVTPDEVTSGMFTERPVTQVSRQAEFEAYRTTDDHLMHIVGKSNDQFGRSYFKAKNCWGREWGRDGYAYLSETYLKMKAISVTLHKKGLTKSTAMALGI